MSEKRIDDCKSNVIPVPKNAKEMITLWLLRNGYDGLYQDGCCACKINDLIPCEADPSACQPGYLQPGPHDDDFMIGWEKQVLEKEPAMTKKTHCLCWDCRHQGWCQSKDLRERVKELEEALKKSLFQHRNVVVCPPDCWCWDGEAALNELEKGQSDE